MSFVCEKNSNQLCIGCCECQFDDEERNDLYFCDYDEE